MGLGGASRVILGQWGINEVHWGLSECQWGSLQVDGGQCGLVRNIFAPIFGGKYKRGNKVSLDEPTQEEL